jgi:folate-dependent phosphoribosylglycinamide formyltransferase PurN
MQNIYSLKINQKNEIIEPMRVVFFFSGGASSMKFILEKAPHYGKFYKIVCAFTDNPLAEKGKNVAISHNIPLIVFDRKTFYREKNLDPKIFDSRKFYYEEVLKKIGKYNPDLIALSGYMHIISDPLLNEFKNRIFNVHPADLTILKKKTQNAEFSLPIEVIHAGKMDVKSVINLIKKENLERAYKGEDSVADAILNGEKYTKSTVHIATEDFDEGPIIVQSKEFPVDENFILRKLKSRNWSAIIEYAHKLQETMKWEGDGPAYAKALELTAKGRLSIHDFSIYLDGEELPYCGYQLS